MQEQKQIRVTSAEMAQLWTQYLNDSASICLLAFFLEKAEDGEITPIIEFALSLSQSHVKKISSIFLEEKYAIPNGFCLEEDVDLSAPRLYSDTYALHFIHQMAMIGLTAYSASVSSSVRADITEYYVKCLDETVKLLQMSKDLLLEKGLFIRPPFAPNTETVDFVKKQRFLWDIVGEKRPLIVAEVGNLFANIQRNTLGIATLFGFSQGAQSKEVKDYFLRGIDIAKKHIKIFGGKLEESNLPIPMSWSSEVSNSTVHTFSDKLTMFYTTGLNSLSIGYYGTATSQSPRVDLGVMYNRLSLEVQLYSEDGANIMIQNKWLEQPPMAIDREEL